MAQPTSYTVHLTFLPLIFGWAAFLFGEEEAILELKPALVEKGYQFSERQKFWENFLDTKAPILRIPATYEQRVC